MLEVMRAHGVALDHVRQPDLHGAHLPDHLAHADHTVVCRIHVAAGAARAVPAVVTRPPERPPVFPPPRRRTRLLSSGGPPRPQGSSPEAPT